MKLKFALAATTYASATTIICDRAVSGSSACNSGAPGAPNTVQISTVLSLDSAFLANAAVFAPTLAGALISGTLAEQFGARALLFASSALLGVAALTAAVLLRAGFAAAPR
jgi:hypothetical protein